MKYYEEGKLVDQSACAEWRADLKKCLLESECCKDRKKTPRECLRNPEGQVPDECFMIKNGFFQCKRSLIDMRSRFRGIKK